MSGFWRNISFDANYLYIYANQRITFPSFVCRPVPAYFFLHGPYAFQYPTVSKIVRESWYYYAHNWIIKQNNMSKWQCPVSSDKERHLANTFDISLLLLLLENLPRWSQAKIWHDFSNSVQHRTINADSNHFLHNK